MSAYYNEIDPYAAEWLRNLIKAGHIADGVVDDRSISDVRPEELFEFTQCHFFAGIGIWSLALRGAGWADDQPVWTGSCPCQPFSGAGKRAGTSDERHLWPHWNHLIQECRPATIFGEQVASKDGLGWLDLVQTDMEAKDYAFGAFDLCAASFGAPHIRQRIWFVADTDDTGSQGRVSGRTDQEREVQHGHLGRNGSTNGGLGDTDINDGRDKRGSITYVGEARVEHGSASSTNGLADTQRDQQRAGRGAGREDQARDERGFEPSGRGTVDGLADTDSHRAQREPRDIGEAPTVSQDQRQPEDGSDVSQRGGEDQHGRGVIASDGVHGSEDGASKTNGHWGDADWLFCRDGKWRPVEPDTCPLVDGATSRVGRLRAYGNGIVPQVAQGLIESYMETRKET